MSLIASSPPTISARGMLTGSLAVHRWSTPARLLGLLVGSWLTAALLLLVTLTSTSDQRGAFQTIGRDAAPSIIAAQRIRAALSDMDANVANALLNPPDQPGQAWDDFDRRRKEATEALVDAAKNITYGEAERQPILAMLNQLEVYLTLVGQARALQRQDATAAIARYRDASSALQQQILPAADALDKTNLGELDRAYDGQKQDAERFTLVVRLAGLALLGVLVGTQIFLFRRMRRVVNPPLLAATLIAFFFLFQLDGALAEGKHRLKNAKEDAFTSIYALWRARSVAFDANADESRYLLDPARAQQYEQDFFRKAALLTDAKDVKQAVNAAKNGTVIFNGYLADELRNITYKGEAYLALDALSKYGDYLTLDGTIRSLEQSGKHQEAVAFCIGYGPGQSNEAYAQFDTALGKVIDLNESEFKRAVDAGFDAMRPYTLAGPVVALAIALLAWLGLRPRLNEYRV